MSDRRHGITGYVAGGLGNQLFILAAAWEQAERLGCPLLLDISHFAVGGTRGFELDSLDVPARVLSPKESWHSLRLSPERVLPVPTKWGRLFVERDSDSYAEAVSRLTAGTTMLGYFQSPKYFPTVAAPLVDALQAHPETPQESALLAEYRSEPAITLHLRRGDYLAVPTDRQFIASVDYAKRAISLLRAMGMDLPIRVFSDSVDLVVRELAGVRADIRVVPEDAPLGIWATLKAMASAEAMIMSNSSFSWWAGTLMRARNESAPIIAPRPWTRGGTAKADLLGPDWITLDAR